MEGKIMAVCISEAKGERKRPVPWITLQKEHLIANGYDSTSIFADALDSIGLPVMDSTPIYFAHTGSGYLAANRLLTLNGRVRNRLVSPPNIIGGSRTDTIYALDYPGDSSTVSDTAVVQYIPGPIHQISFVYPESTVTMVAGSGDTKTALKRALKSSTATTSRTGGSNRARQRKRSLGQAGWFGQGRTTWRKPTAIHCVSACGPGTTPDLTPWSVPCATSPPSQRRHPSWSRSPWST